MLACSSSYWTHFGLRLVVGAALAVVNPIGQAIICDVVREEERGWAFGLLQGVSTGLSMAVSFFTISIARSSILGVQGWRVAYVLVAGMSVLTGMAVYAFVPAAVSSEPRRKVSWISEQIRVVKVVAAKKSFLVMVGQGVVGGIPWNAFAFLTFYFQLSGYTDLEVGQIMMLGGVGGVLGALLGGRLGDAANRIRPYSGRCFVAQTSVVLGTICFLWFINIPFGPNSIFQTVLAFWMFHAVACWTPSTLRPICGEIVTNGRDRAQILALWIALEGIIASFCGAPLAGVLSEAFGYKLQKGQDSTPAGEKSESLAALRTALIGVSIIPWTFCALAWIPMYWAYPRDAKANASPSDSDMETEGKHAGGAPSVIGREAHPIMVESEK